jgi:hypothetical protein
MTYVKPEVVELLRAAKSIQGSDGGTSSDKTHQAPESGDNDSGHASTTSSAYQADE